ncbi:MAG: hypothetical protein A2Y24_06455 [Clostridiales bacterium GWE2_32_10]|nr:MAG: hypothetical protein A2Y24_06455 [Clostridiales bacterium GWE2_32_10]HBY20848.1 hypothetical protein [Clostridiales bacterium]
MKWGGNMSVWITQNKTIIDLIFQVVVVATPMLGWYFVYKTNNQSLYENKKINMREKLFDTIYNEVKKHLLRPNKYLEYIDYMNKVKSNREAIIEKQEKNERLDEDSEFWMEFFEDQWTNHYMSLYIQLTKYKVIFMKNTKLKTTTTNLINKIENLNVYINNNIENLMHDRDDNLKDINIDIFINFFELNHEIKQIINEFFDELSEVCFKEIIE